MPEQFPYGTLYTSDDLNQALMTENPLDIVPSRDEEGHGTFMAGIIAGSEDRENDFIGAAPEASIIAVKLKPAKNYLRDYYVLKEGSIAFQETDIFMAVQFSLTQAVKYQMPLVICLGMGNNLDSHEGTSFLSQYLNSVNNLTGVCVTVAAGNELGKAHHFQGSFWGRMTVRIWNFGWAKENGDFNWKYGVPLPMFFPWRLFRRRESGRKESVAAWRIPAGTTLI